MRTALFALCLTLQAQDASVLKEIALGRQLAAEVRRTTIPVDSQEIQDYVAQLGARIAAQFPERGIPYTFSVVKGWAGHLNEPQVLPGAYVFVPLGLFASVNDEDEFAGMLTQAAARSTLLLTDQAHSGPVIFAGGPLNQNAVPASAICGMAERELKADSAAVPAMARAGFDPGALLRYIERTETPKGLAANYFSTLPPREERIASLSEALSTAPQVVSASSDAFTAIQQQVRAEAAQAPRPTLRREGSPLQLR